MLETYISDLQHADPAVRYNAAQELGRLRDVRALTALVEALPTADEKLQYAVFSSLLKLGDARAAEPLLIHLASHLNSRLWGLMRLNIGMRLRHGLLELLPRGDASVLVRVREALTYEELDTQQRAFFTRALGKVGSADEIELLLGLLRNEGNEVRVAAAEALGWIGHERAVGMLLVLLHDASDQIREVAVEALGRIGDERAVEPIIRALQDRTEWVRRAAAVALGLLADRRALEPLAAAMHDEDEMVQDAAFEALKRFSTDSFTTVI
jgi:HEAT repeat protein